MRLFPRAPDPVVSMHPMKAKRHAKRPGLAALLLLSAAAFPACGDGGPQGAPAATTAAPTASATAPAGPVKHPPRRREGSAAALSTDGQRVIVADEVHDAVLVVPTSFADLSAVRVVPVPGPPAQVVTTDDLVLVTVRTLPADDAQAVRADIRGPQPDPAAVRRLEPGSLVYTGQNDYLAPKEYAHFLQDAPPPASSGAASAKAPSSARPGASARPPSKGGTPSKPFDANVVRRSQGGLLLAFRPDAERGLVEVGRAALPPDAWGLALTPDGLRAVVTSAWSSRISVVDVNSMKVLATLDAAAEPRGVTVTADGKTAYVSHLRGADLTRIDDLDAAPKLAAQPLPAGLSRTSEKAALGASLAYSIVLSPDGESVYVPRHAIGAEGHDSWWGAPVVDVLDRKSGKPVAPPRRPRSPGHGDTNGVAYPADWEVAPGRLPGVRGELVQPRAIVYRKKTDTLLVAGEGFDTLVELDALAPDPAMFMRTRVPLAVYDAFGHHPVRGGAPAAIALSDDEDTAYVYCSTTFDLVKVDLLKFKGEWLRLAEDGLPDDAKKGRRLFANARSTELSGGLACAGCHPEGRDDGHVWVEALLNAGKSDEDAVFLGLRSNIKQRLSGVFGNGSGESEEANLFYPRQTPMIAGRVRSPGPYGWHAEAKNLVERLMRGFRLHRAPWDSVPGTGDYGPYLAKIDALGDFIQSGLLPPPTLVQPLSGAEKRGKEIFESDQAQCARCHVPATDLTDRTAYPLRALPALPGMDAEKNAAFKTPSLLFIGGTAPYFHDGSAATLEDLVKNNGSRMGQTAHLSPEDQAALVAYLKTL